MKTIKIKNPLKGPTFQLCWKQETDGMVRCDRKKGHKGQHSWEMANRVKELENRIEKLANKLEEMVENEITL